VESSNGYSGRRLWTLGTCGFGGLGLWICYYLVDHPNKGRCHYFHIKPDITNQLPDKTDMEYILKEFGVENALMDEHITINNKDVVVNIILPI
jgi:hypothetical protein